jgi:imidazolonepropionase-like amidohydrolase
VTTTAIENVRVFDGARTSEGVTIVFDDRIQLIGSAHEVQVPQGARRVEGAGQTVVPGLIDMHAHVQSDEWLTKYLVHGITTMKDVGNRLAPSVEWRRATTAGEILGPELLICGPVIDGPEPMWPENSFAVDDAESAVRAVDELSEARVDGVKLYVYLEPAPMRVVIERAHEHGLSVTAHLGATSASEAIGLGLDGIEHAAQGCYLDVVPAEFKLDAGARGTLGIGPFWARFMAGWARVDPESDAVRRFADLVAESDVYLTPTIVILEETLAGTNEHIRRLIDQWTPEDFAVADEGFSRVLAVVGVLHEAGALVVAGTDCLLDHEIGDSLYRELELLVSAGLSPAAALTSTTRGAARALGRVNDLGAVSVGRSADLVLVEGDPTADISDIRQVRAVFKAGQPVSAQPA